MRDKRELDNVSDVHTRALRAAGRNGDGGRLQELKHEPEVISFWERFLPYGRRMRMMQEAKGVFIPYPLLGIIITLCTIVVAGIIAIQVQVSNLSTTILLRDADQRAVTQELKEKSEQLEVYIHDDREKLIRLLDREEQRNKRRE